MNYNYILIIALAFLGGIFFYHLISKLMMRYRLGIRFKKGRSGETKAGEYLVKKGFKIIGEQIVIKSQIFVDDKPCEYQIRIDYIVKKYGKTSAVEVKTGDKASDPLNTDTRRQLYEYLNVLNADYIYLFDADQCILKKVFFKPKKNKTAFFIFFLLIIILFLFLIIVLLKK